MEQVCLVLKNVLLYGQDLKTSERSRENFSLFHGYLDFSWLLCLPSSVVYCTTQAEFSGSFVHYLHSRYVNIA